MANADSVSEAAFEIDCRTALNGLRAALIELYAGVGADPTEPQEVARRFGVNKTLAWNASKVLTGDDSLGTATNLPGPLAFQSLLGAFERGGASPVALERVRSAVRQIDATVERHVGDRGTLELVIDGMGEPGSDRLALSRKLAFRGNSGLLGAQAKTRLMSVFLAPHLQDSSLIDIASVQAYLGVRRLRTDVRWPLFHVRAWSGDVSEPIAQPWSPLDPEGGTPLLRGFSSVRAEDLELRPRSNGFDCALAPGPIGNVAAVDCCAADFARAAVRAHRTEGDATGAFGATIAVPTERLVFDLIAHRSLAFAMSPEVIAYVGVFAGADGRVEEPLTVPIPRSVVRLPGCPPVLSTPAVPRYAELAQFVHDRMGWLPDQFVACRYELDHPPLGSTVVLRFALPEA